MTFPESPRVIYEKNPLQEVVCQLSFPPILRIGSTAPAEYQELIRREYPLFEETPTAELPADISPELSKLLADKALLGSPTMDYEFASVDGNWVVDLTRDSLTFTSYDYKRWEDYRSHLRGPFEAFLRCIHQSSLLGLD